MSTSMQSRHQRAQRDAKRHNGMPRDPYPSAMRPPYEGAPPSWDEPEPTDTDIELGALDIATDRAEYEDISETLAGNAYYLDRLHDLGKNRHMREKLTDADYIRIAKTIEDCIEEATETMALERLS